MDYRYSQKKAAAADRNTKERDYWLERLAGELSKAVFYYDYNTPKSDGGKRKNISFRLTGDIFVRLCRLSKNSHYALHIIFAAVITILLNKYTNLEDIIIGSPIYKQDSEGEFINTLLALRNRVKNDMTFKEFLLQVKDAVTEAVDNQNYPIETLLYKLNMEFSAHDFPLFDVLVLVENVHDKKYIQPINPNVIFSFLQTAEAVEGVVEYNAGLYEPAAIERIIDHFTCLLQAALTNLDMNLGSIPILTEKEKERLICELNNSKRPIVRDKCYHRLFEEQAAKSPDRAAAVHNDKHITYGELNERSNRLAALLRERGVIPDRLAAVLCARSIEMLTGIIGIFKAGGAYIPLEVDFPLQRIKTILKDSEAPVLLVDSTAVSRAGTLPFYGAIGNSTDVNDIIFLDQPGDSQWNSELERNQDLFRTYKLARRMSRGSDNETYSHLPPVHKETIWRYGDQILTHDQCMAGIRRLQRFIAAKELFKNKERETSQPQAAVILDNPLYMIATLAALKSYHIPFIVVTPPLNKENKKELADSLSISTIFSESRFLDELDQLFWESRTLENYIIVDHYDYKSSEKESDLRKVWDAAAGDSSEAINDYRWNSIYTGEPFSLEEMNQYIANIRVKLEPYLTAAARVLEVGCGHGLVLFELAPRVGYYYATDLTPVIIEKNRARVQREGLNHVELKAAAASRIDTLEVRDFDIFICSSVIHFFPNTLFLEEVIKSAIDILNDEGIIYLDDMLDLRRKQDLIDSKIEYRQNHPGSRTWQGNEDSDLYVDIDFFHYLQDKYPEIVQWEYSRKLGTIENELTRFRFDVLIKIDKKKPGKDTGDRMQRAAAGKSLYTARDIEMMEMPPDFPFPNAVLPPTDIKDALEPVGDVLPGSCIERYPGENLKSVNKPLDLSYLIYTSGTTGTPRGVMIHHQGMLNHIEAKINDLAITADDVIAQTASACFDISVWQFLAGLLTGGSTLIIDKESVLDPQALLEIIQKGKVTIWESVPSSMTAFLHLAAYKSEKERRLNRLRWMILTGEASGFHLVKKWYANYPGIKVLNAYGPTEAADDVTHYVVQDIPPADRTPANVPIGKPIQNTHIYILDRNLSLCPTGVRGEICVAGMGIGRGYWKAPDKTEKSFIPNPYIAEIGDPDYAVLYKTGDIGYFMEDGNIQCLGRLDHQVKIRGFRIEPAEIENRLVNHGEITEAVVMVRTMSKPDEPGESGRGPGSENKYLCAYFVAKPGSPIAAAELREYLAGDLPGYMLPSYWVKLEKVPLTVNGKIDRNALPIPELSVEESYIAPRNKLEEKLAAIWSDVLALEKEKISIDADFFELGGHSLKAAILISRIHKELDVKLPLVEIFKTPDIKGLAGYIQGMSEDKYVSIQPVEEKEYYTLSSAQMRLYILQQMEVESIAYNVPMMAPLDAGIPGVDAGKKAIEHTIRRLIDRHESFRTSFEIIDELPVQRIHPMKDIHFEIEYYDLDAKACSEADPEPGKQKNNLQQTPANLMKNFVRPFDLSRQPLLRVGLAPLDQNRYVLFADMHHIISDGISQNILKQDFMSLLKGRELPLLLLQYKDYTEWQNRDEIKESIRRQADYWLKEFTGEIPLLNLPVDYERTGKMSFEGNSFSFTIDDILTSRVKKCALDMGVTSMMLLFSIYQLLLARYAGREEVIVGTVVAGRRYTDLENIIGFFVNMLAIKTNPHKDKTFSEYLLQVKEKILGAHENQEYQFEELVSNLNIQRQPGRHPLVDAVFAFWEAEDSLPGERKDKVGNLDTDLFNISHFDLMLHAVEAAGSTQMRLEYSTRLFKTSTIEEFAGFYTEILAQAVENPSIRLKDLRIDFNLSPSTSTMLEADQGDWEF